MNPRVERRQLVLLSLVVAITIAFALFSISVTLVEKVHGLLRGYGRFEWGETVSYIALLSSTFLLWLSYRKWRAASRRNEELENVISSISPDVLLVVSVDRTIVMCGGSATRMFGYPPDEILGKKTSFLYLDRRADPERPYEIHEILEREGYHIGFATGKRKDGKEIPLEIITGTLSGRSGAVLLIRDITDRKRAEDVLRESEEKYRTFFEDSLEPMSLTIEGKIADVNPAWLLLHGFSDKADVLGMDVARVVHPDDQHILTERRALPYERRSRIFQLRDIRKDGRPVDVEVYSSAITLGGKLAILSTVHDITEQKRLQREVIQSDKLAALATVVSGTTHELSNPLTAISGYAHLLADDDGVSESARADVKKILSQVERCSRIIGSLLRFARRERDECGPVNVNDVLARSMDLRRYDARTRNIRITEEYAPHLPLTSANASRLEQAFLNIINNAYDAMLEHKVPGKIALRTRMDSDHIVIEIEDNGGGMKEPDRVFEPFYTTKEVGKGTGLGLSVTYGIVQDYGGTIHARNTQEGACFTIRLPVVAPTASARAAPEPPKPVRPPSAPPLAVLVVDDEECVTDVASSSLTKRGCLVETCASAEEAIERLKAARFDVVVSDVIMPGAMTVRDLYAWIQANLPALAKRVIFMTGSVTGARTKELLSGIGNPVIHKPFSPAELSEAVDRATAEA